METSAKNRSKEPLILVADDDEACLEVLVKMLAALGYDVFAVRDGRSAIDAYKTKKHQINLVILDMNMPCNGEKTYTKLRKINKHVRILLISGYTEDSRVRKLLKQGLCGFLGKPFNLNSLKLNVANMINSLEN